MYPTSRTNLMNLIKTMISMMISTVFKLSKVIGSSIGMKVTMIGNYQACASRRATRWQK